MQHIDRCSTYRQNGAAVRQTIRIHNVLLVKILSVFRLLLLVAYRKRIRCIAARSARRIYDASAFETIIAVFRNVQQQSLIGDLAKAGHRWRPRRLCRASQFCVTGISRLASTQSQSAERTAAAVGSLVAWNKYFWYEAAEPCAW